MEEQDPKVIPVTSMHSQPSTDISMSHFLYLFTFACDGGCEIWYVFIALLHECKNAMCLRPYYCHFSYLYMPRPDDRWPSMPVCLFGNRKLSIPLEHRNTEAAKRLG